MSRLSLILAFLLAQTVRLSAQLVISEFLASNSNSIRDEDGVRPSISSSRGVSCEHLDVVRGHHARLIG